MPEDERDEQNARDRRFTWPPTPKTQIWLIAIALGLFNLLLILIWAVALYMTR